MKPILNKTSVNCSLTATDPHTNQQIESQQIENEQIQLRAYELYEQRGREDGHHVEDWLQAETEVSMQQAAPSPIESLAA